MSKEKISSQEIIDLLSAQTDFTKRQSEDFLKAMFGIIEERLIAGETVKIKNLGTFKSQWNKSRKSVNVQTGEEFIIPGFRKISFLPDSVLKNIVNEPYAHLEATVLDSNLEISKENNKTEEKEPLNILTEQAIEIQGLLSEIQGFPNIDKELKTEKANTTEIPQESVIQIDESTVILFNKIQERMHQKTENESDLKSVKEDEMKIQESEYFINRSNNLTSEIMPTGSTFEKVEVETSVSTTIIKNTENEDNTSSKSETNHVSESNNLIDSSFEPKEYRVKRKSKWWIILLFIIIALVVGFIGVYLLSSATRCWLKYELFSDKNIEKATDIKNNILNTFGLGEAEIVPKAAKIEQDSVVIPQVIPQEIKDTLKVDSMSVTQTKDTIVDVFNKPREYNEFIGTEILQQGNTLANLSRIYYKHKDFWVYIYEANKDKTKNPDIIGVGTIIRIPKIDPKLIDLENPVSLKKAKELHDLYIQKQ